MTSARPQPTRTRTSQGPTRRRGGRAEYCVERSIASASARAPGWVGSGRCRRARRPRRRRRRRRRPRRAPTWAAKPARNSAASPRMSTSPGTMNAAPPTSAPTGPATRHAEKMASWVEAGPGNRLHAAIASSNSPGVSHPSPLDAQLAQRARCGWAGRRSRCSRCAPTPRRRCATADVTTRPALAGASRPRVYTSNSLDTSNPLDV